MKTLKKPEKFEAGKLEKLSSDLNAINPEEYGMIRGGDDYGYTWKKSESLMGSNGVPLNEGPPD